MIPSRPRTSGAPSTRSFTPEFILKAAKISLLGDLITYLIYTVFPQTSLSPQGVQGAHPTRPGKGARPRRRGLGRRASLTTVPTSWRQGLRHLPPCVRVTMSVLSCLEPTHTFAAPWHKRHGPCAGTWPRHSPGTAWPEIHSGRGLMAASLTRRRFLDVILAPACFAQASPGPLLTSGARAPGFGPEPSARQAASVPCPWSRTLRTYNLSRGRGAELWVAV